MTYIARELRVSLTPPLNAAPRQRIDELDNGLPDAFNKFWMRETA